MKYLRPIVLFLTVVLVSACMTEGQAQQAPKSLYQRLGGYDAIAAVSDEFIGRLAGDPQFNRFFAGFSNDSKIRLRQHIVDQLCQATGGPCFYTGRTMVASHTGLKITDADWNTAGGHMVASLDKFRVKQKEKDEAMALITSLKGDIAGR